jgi:class 3 adenylate cyclase
VAAHAELRFNWIWDLAAPPAALWPLVSNTDRFNRDCGYPAVQVVAAPASARERVTNARRLRAMSFGFVAEWDELAFEWVAPERFAVERTFHRGPVARMFARCELAPRASGGTTMRYETRVTPANLLGRLALPFAIGWQAKARFDRVLRRYDEFAMRGLRRSQLARRPVLASGGTERLAAIARTLIDDARQPSDLVAKLQTFIANADDTAAARIRPYAVADDWRTDRRETLHLFLHATRAGLLDFSWDLVCPHCRGAKTVSSTLSAVRAQAHCDTCDVDFTANFDQSVELTFTPNAAVRPVVRADYCVGGPQVTPHIVAQQRFSIGERRTLHLALTPGRYRVRTSGLAEQQAFRVEAGGAAAANVTLGASRPDEPALAVDGELTLLNATETERLVVIEHLAWSDQATTAAEVTSLQLFRDLFSREVLRPGEQISVGTMTIVFTDLKNSTRLYQEIGDAPAFGRVLTHFEILKETVAAENGAIVKTMGDAIMAVFPRPVAAVRALVRAQEWLAAPDKFALPPGVSVPPSSLEPLALKAGIHCGPCLAINQNERLDYFGTTVNFTARLCGLCTGADMVLSDAAKADPEVTAYLADTNARLTSAPERTCLRGFGETAYNVWRIAQRKL